MREVIIIGKVRDRMKKAEFIERYGEEAWGNHLAQGREYYKAHKEEMIARTNKYQEEHPEKAKANNQESNRKGGKYYNRKLKYMCTGIQGARCKIRVKHANQYRPYKDIIAPESQVHHQWLKDTAGYKGIALVEKNAHQHEIIDVIQVLDGKITLLTEKEVKM